MEKVTDMLANNNALRKMLIKVDADKIFGYGKEGIKNEQRN